MTAITSTAALLVVIIACAGTSVDAFFMTCQCYCTGFNWGSLPHSYPACTALNCANAFPQQYKDCFGYVYARSFDASIIGAIIGFVALVISGIVICVWYRRKAKTQGTAVTSAAYTTAYMPPQGYVIQQQQQPVVYAAPAYVQQPSSSLTAQDVKY